MNNSVKTKSWVFVVVLIVLFWPVGLYFLIQKLRYDKTATFKSTIPLYIAGGFIAAMGIAGLSMVISGEKTVDKVNVAMSFSDTIMYTLLSIAFFAGSFFVLRKAYTMSRQRKDFKKYIEIVINEEEYSIEHISVQLSIVPDVVVRDIEVMIERGIFKNAHIDRARSMIVFDENNQDIQVDVYAETQTARSVICPGCGAKNTIKGTNVQCEYCGTILQ